MRIRRKTAVENLKTSYLLWLHRQCIDQMNWESDVYEREKHPLFQLANELEEMIVKRAESEDET